MNGLDLFSGIGGLSLALKPWVETVAYCESDRHAQCVLMQNMRRGYLEEAPIWDDVRTLRREHLEIPIDIIFGGFPCQDISAAGRGAGLEGKRSGLFFEVVRLVQEIRPTFVFLENVPAIRTRGLREVIREFTDLRYDCRWTCVSAADVGAPHLRRRWWMLAANTDSAAFRDIEQRKEIRRDDVQAGGKTFAGDDGAKELVAHTTSRRQSVCGRSSWGGRHALRRGMQTEGRIDERAWAAEPDVGGTFNGLSSGMDGVGGLGDAEADETGASEIMQYLREYSRAEALQRATRGLDIISATEFLLTFVREYEEGGRLPRGKFESAETPEEVLRAMRENREPSCSPCRRRPIEQFFREYPNALRELSQLVASRGAPPWSNPLWECAVPRIESGVPLRVDRLRGLGNSVVPAAAREAFERLAGMK